MARDPSSSWDAPSGRLEELLARYFYGPRIHSNCGKYRRRNSHIRIGGLTLAVAILRCAPAMTITGYYVSMRLENHVEFS